MIKYKMLPVIATLFALSTCFAQSSKEPATCLIIHSDPEGAEITVNHRERGITPLTITDLPAGRYLIRASHEGYSDSFESTTLQPGITRNVKLMLTPELGLLLVDSEPAGAEVTTKGVSLGSTPLLVTTLRPGDHRLSISLPGFQTKEIDLTLNGRTPHKEVVALVADSGTLNITSEPAGAEVQINGITRGRTPCEIDRIPGGSVKLEVRQDGYTPHLRDIALAAGERQQVNIQLEPLPGSLKIVTIPEGARVYLGNEFKGESPHNFVDITPGSYRIRVELAGHTPMARDIEVEKGTSRTEEFRLTGNTGILTIITAPAGATILVNGKKAGITEADKAGTSAVSNPLSIGDIMAGEHEVEIIRQGYAPQKRPFTIIQDQTTALQIKLVRQFIPNYEVTTTRSYYKGVIEFISEEGIRLETAPGVSQTIPMRDIKSHGILKED
ncbi:MAG: PEGA domain-containing protein [Kiritimatiellae bacterium]|nr:PEGA domain-containing protein [Kiritimatiellia bacterium]